MADLGSMTRGDARSITDRKQNQDKGNEKGKMKMGEIEIGCETSKDLSASLQNMSAHKMKTISEQDESRISCV